MKRVSKLKVVFAFVLVLTVSVVVSGCMLNSTSADDEQFSYYERVDKKNNNSSILKLVDKESGCKYLIVKSTSNGFTSTVQMMGADGLPLCN